MQAPSQAPTRRGAQPAALAQRLDGSLDDARRQAAPAGVGRGDGAAVGRSQQHRQAVGRLDDAGDARARW